MKKKLSKLIAVLFILTTTLGGAITGMAVDTGPLAPDSGSLTIHKYLYDVDGIGEGDGKEVTEVNDLAKLAGKEIRGVQFDVYKVGSAITTGAPEVVPGGAEWSYSISDGKLVATKGTDSYEYNIGSNLNATKTADNGSVKLDPLESGYYFVVENLGESKPEMNNGTDWEPIAITTPAKPFVVAVPMTDPDDLDKWITDVHVYPKNQTTDVVKEPSKPSVNVGETLNWTIAVELPTDIKDYQKFIATDKLDEALTYTANSVKVYKAEKSGDKWIKSSPEVQLASFTPNFEDSTNTLTVNLIVGKDQMTTENWEGLIIEFETKVNEKLEGKDVNIIGNKATVNFTNKEGQDSEKESNSAEVDAGDVVINKVDKDDEKLKGAEFQIARTKEEAEKGIFIKIKQDSSLKITEIVYPEDSGYDSAKPWIVKPNSETAGDFTKFEGLKTHTVDSNGDITYEKYWIVETKAPEGYNLAGDPIEVDFANSEEADSKLTYEVIREVINNKGFTLPNTGGVGTIILAIAGIILIGLAIILSMNKKKKTA